MSAPAKRGRKKNPTPVPRKEYVMYRIEKEPTKTGRRRYGKVRVIPKGGVRYSQLYGRPDVHFAPVDEKALNKYLKQRGTRSAGQTERWATTKLTPAQKAQRQKERNEAAKAKRREVAEAKEKARLKFVGAPALKQTVFVPQPQSMLFQ